MADKALSCALVFCRSPGMATDAAVLAAAIRACRPDAQIVTFELHPQFMRDYTTPVAIKEELRARLPFDFVFLLEHAHPNPPFLDPGFARHVAYVPNVEWITPSDEDVIASGSIDTVLLKTRYSGTVFSSLPCCKSIQTQLYTGWTSADIGQPAADERSWAQCVHVCGKSPQKNADAVVAVWLRNPGFPPMSIVANVVAGLDLHMPLRASVNLAFRLKHLPEPERRALQRQSGLHVYPSFAEGFGHSLNEARAAAAVLITTGGPPMNELIEDGVSGILVPVRPENQTPYHRVTAYRVTADDLEQSIQRALHLSDEQRLTMGSRARALYEHDRHLFQTAIREFFTA